MKDERGGGGAKEVVGEKGGGSGMEEEGGEGGVKEYAMN